MNRLSRAKRTRILALRDAGHTIREIAREVGCAKATVAGYMPSGFRRVLLKKIDAAFDELEAAGIDTTAYASLLELHAFVGWGCPLHPEAEFEYDEPGEVCPLCRRDGLERHHVRRKLAGQPVLPPWRRKP